MTYNFEETESMELSDLLIRLDEKRNKRNFIFKWIDKKFEPRGLFGYRASYILFHPKELFFHIWLELKWAYQRVSRG